LILKVGVGIIDVLYWYVLDPVTSFDEHKCLEVYRHVKLNVNSMLRSRMEKSLRIIEYKFP
jgi:hypothetical protein